VSGVTLVVQKLGRALAERGHHVTVLTGSDTHEAYSALEGGVRIVRLRSSENPYWAANPTPRISPRRLLAFVAHERPDVIHAHDALPLALQLVREREQLGVPIVATCHFFPSFVAAYMADGTHARSAIEALAWRYSIALYRRMDEVVFATSMHREQFIEHGLDARTRVISNGIDLTRYAPGLPLLDALGGRTLPPHPRVLAVGRLAKDKNLGVLIRAMAEDGARAAHLLVVGEGPEGESLRDLARAVGVAERVHFLGFVPEHDMPRLFCSCDAFAIASYFEVQSLPALQAAATGLPLVAAAQGALPELCRDGENGVLVHDGSPAAFAHAMARVLRMEDSIRMGAASLAVASRHDERRTFDAYVSLYEEALRTQAERESTTEPTAETVAPPARAARAPVAAGDAR
jgi:glycosyltransferase involved in cell wall biosynthesis